MSVGTYRWVAGVSRAVGRALGHASAEGWSEGSLRACLEAKEWVLWSASSFARITWEQTSWSRHDKCSSYFTVKYTS
jgi:hypothetical protein